MLIRVNDHLVVNPDLIGAGSMDEQGEQKRWRLAIVGLPDHQVVLTLDEMDQLITEVSQRQLVALIRLADGGIHEVQHETQPPGDVSPGQGIDEAEAADS